MHQANTTNQQTTTPPKRTIPLEFFSVFILLWEYLKTLFLVIFRPGLFVANRSSHPEAALPPGPFFLLTVAGFCILASYFPIMSEPVASTSFSQAFKRIPALLNISLYGILKMYAINLLMLVIGVSVVLGACSGRELKEFPSNAGLTCYFLSNIMAAVAIKFLLGSLIVTGLLRTNFMVSLVNERFLDIRYIDLLISLLLFLSILGYPYYLFKEKEALKKQYSGLVFAVFLILLGVVSVNGYYFKGKLASQVIINQQPKENRKGAPLGRATDSTNLRRNVNIMTTSDSVNIPYNKTIIISSGNINATIHFAAHRFNGKYWLDAKFQIKNTTTIPVYLPFNRLVKVYISLGTESLLNRMYLGDKQFPFEIVSREKGALILGANDSIQLKIRYGVNSSMYKYLKYEYGRGLLKDHKVFLEMMMLNNNTAFPVNKQGVWDMHFY